MGMYSDNGGDEIENDDDNRGFDGCRKGFFIAILCFLLFLLAIGAIVSQWN